MATNHPWHSILLNAHVNNKGVSIKSSNGSTCVGHITEVNDHIITMCIDVTESVVYIAMQYIVSVNVF